MRFLPFGLVVTVVAAPLEAGEITVPGDFATIQAAISSAVDGDVVVVAPGGYAGQISFMGKAITVTSEDPLDPAATTLTAGFGSVVTFNNGEGQGSKLIGFTIDNVAAVTGGGAYIGPSANPVIENCIFEGNFADQGGGLALLGSALVRDTTFVGNIATSLGGGIWAGPFSNLTLVGCRFEGNDAPTASAFLIHHSGTVVNTEVFDNVNGVAVFINGANLVDMVNCTIVNNAPGGISLNGTAAFPLTIANCIVRANGFQINGPGPLLDVRYSNIGGGFAGPGNINANPLFVNAPAGNFRLGPASPCIDAGENPSVPAEVVYDFGGIVRFADKSDIVDTGVGKGPIVDIGAHEYPPARRYVKADAPGNNTGMTWTHAYTDLQDALADAAGGADIEQIWVATGTYYPDGGTGDRTLSFKLRDNLEIIGGFAGTEIDAAERDPESNPTTLGGAIGAAGVADNSYHVVSATNVNANGKLIGFIIQRGQADGVDEDSFGGGIYVEGGAPAIRECVVRLNHATTGGGGIYCVGADSNIIRTRVSINTSDNGGAGLLLLGGAPDVINCVVSGNEASDAAGVFVTPATTADLVNCTIVGNDSSNGQAGGITSYGDLIASNCIIGYNNGLPAGSTEEEQVEIAFGSGTFEHCCIDGWSGALAGTFNIGNDPLFINPVGPDGVFGTIDDDLRLGTNSPCIDSADSDALPAFVDLDFAGNDRFLDDTGMPNLGGGASPYLDRGAYEHLGNSCLGDLEIDALINVDDLLEVIGNWGACNECLSDLNADGIVNVDDLLIVIGGWGPCALN